MKRTLLSIIALVALSPALAQEAPVPAAGPVALDHPGLRAGDAKAAMGALLAAIEAAPTDAQAALLLAELRQVWAWVPGGPAECARRLQAVADRLAPHPLKDDLLAALVDLRRIAGDVEGARALQTSRGFVREFLVAGSFGIAPGASLDEVFEPELATAERDIDPKARFKALRGEVTWAPVTIDSPDTAVAVARGVTRRGAVTYALAHVEVPAAAAGEGWLVYTGPSARLFLNRSLASEIDRTRERLDQELMVPVRFAAGWNRLLVKVGDGRGARFTLRLVDGKGAPIVGKGSLAPQPVEVGGDAPTPPRSSDGLTRLATQTAPDRQALYAHALAITGRGEEAWTILDDLRRSAPALEKAAWFWQLLGDITQRADHLPAAARRDQARTAYEKVLALDPKHARARRRLAEFAIQDDKVKDGVLLLEAIVKDHPGDIGTRLRLVEVLLRKQWLLEAERALDEVVTLAPDLPPVLEARATLSEARDRDAEAQGLRERLFAADRSRAWVLLRRLDRAVAEGDRARADATIEALVAQGWSKFDALGRRAEVARAFGDREAELAARRERVRERPWDLDLHVELASALTEDALTSPSARAEAVSVLEAVLAVEPGRHAARRLLLALQGQGDGEDRFWTEWEPDPRKVIAEAPPASHWPRASTACLFDQTVTKIYSDGSSVDVVHQLFKILDPSGIQRYGARPKAGELLTVRTFTPEGEALEPIQAGDSWQMPGLAPGSVVEHAFKTERESAVFQYENGPFYFMDPDLTEPFWLSRWVILVHRDAPVTIVQRNMSRRNITHEVQERGEWLVHIFVARDQPRFEVEPLAPHRDELLPWVRVVEKRPLEEIGAFYREAARAGAIVTMQIARKAEEVTFGLDDDLARARALHDFVQNHVTRGEGGGPATAAQVLASRSGSKTTLLLALLEAARVPHKVGLASSSPDQAEPIDWSIPEPGQFRSRLIRLEDGDGQPVWVFADAHRFAPWGQLPPELWGAPVYTCEGGSGLLEVLPAQPYADEADRTETEVALKAGGAAVVRHRKVLGGFGYYGAKERVASWSPTQARNFFAQQANALFPEARITESELVRMAEPGVPLTFRFAAEAPKVVRPRGDGTLALQALLEPNPLRGLGNYRRREFDLVVREPLVREDTVRLELGPYACARLPRDVTLQTDLLQYSLLHVREGDGHVRIERRLTLRPGRIRPDDYAEFREVLTELDEAERRVLTLEERR